MGWIAKDKDHKDLNLTQEQMKELESAKSSSLPVIQKEVDAQKPFQPMEYQPVRSPGIYDAEFGVKNDNVIFHFWPAGYGEADRSGARLPSFSKSFEPTLQKVLEDVFGSNRFEIHRDDDVGAVFAKVIGYGQNQFHRELAIKACEKLHYALGGE